MSNPSPDAHISSASPPVPVNSAANVDTSFYSWQTWFRALTGEITDEEKRGYLLARDVIKEESDCKRCEESRDWLFKYSPIVSFLQREIADIGPEINSDNVRCRRCTTSQSGGFDSNYGILLCANEMRNRKQVEDTLAHEMVHAYDHVRFKVDPDNMRHQACTEIRASMLSGECRFTREFFKRGQWKITQQLQECVRRRATLSLAARPQIKDDVQAARIINEVWDSCFTDTRPFDEIYR
ncbi:mitochondrial inner membrane protease atp23 [Trichodelitschia bisporula]|uniref:Mitochondrial inner membrane protease ATP23 n=1 Tax=Trichodelitschia bisporula TaxID=703511 RepID=A0A6G1I5R7_9PEZI|nr:mitochondrial inner membrane protease atp23 [Trichodelitschia bisporula]